MLRRIIYFFQVPPTSYDFNRYGIKVLVEAGREVEVWDLSQVFHSQHFLNHSKEPDPMDFGGSRIFRSRAEAVTAIRELDSRDFVVCDLSIPPKRQSIDPLVSIYKSLSKSNSLYCVLEINRLPHAPPPPQVSLATKVRRIARNFMRANPERLYNYARKAVGLATIPYHRFIASPFWRLRSYREGIEYDETGIRPADVLLLSGGKLNAPTGQRIGRKTRILKVPSLDYFEYEAVKSEPSVAKANSTAVFLDSDAVFIPHLAVSDPDHLQPNEYFPQLCEFFDFVEREQRVEIVIAAHPKANYDLHPGCFGGRTVIRAKTPSLVKNARFVLTNASLSLGFAVMFQKPIIFITSQSLDRKFVAHARWIPVIARLLNKSPIYIDELLDIDWQKELSIDAVAYGRYCQDYIIEDHAVGSPNPWLALAETAEELVAEKQGVGRRG